jgi:hypothetical protein
MGCPECYPDQPPCWRDAPMNEEIRKVLTWSRHANVYYYTLDEAMVIWGTQIEENENGQQE